MRLLAEVALVVLTAVAAAVCIALLPATRSVQGRRAAPPQPSRPKQLVRLERLVSTAGTTTAHAHAYLRPVLAEVAARRLARRGLALERMQASVGRELLGDRLWEIVRPDRPFPEDRNAPGVSPAELSEMLERLEGL